MLGRSIFMYSVCYVYADSAWGIICVILIPWVYKYLIHVWWSSPFDPNTTYMDEIGFKAIHTGRS